MKRKYLFIISGIIAITQIAGHVLHDPTAPGSLFMFEVPALAYLAFWVFGLIFSAYGLYRLPKSQR